MKKVMITEILIVIAVLLLAIAAMIAYGLGYMNSALHGHRAYRVESDGHAYTVIMYGTSISAVHDPNCHCLKKTDKEVVGPMDILESPTVKEQ